MATDILSREVTYGDTFSADGVRVTFADFTAGMLVQSAQWTYQQNIARIYEITSNNVYLVTGRTQGTASMSLLAGPKRLMPAFYVKYGDACKARDNHMRLTAVVNCGTVSTGEEQTIDLRHMVIANISGNINAQDMMINTALSWVFLYMTMQ